MHPPARCPYQPEECLAIDNSQNSAAQSVNLTDRIPWQWYLVTAAVPVIGALIGFIAGIVFMARSKIGPALALWTTSFLAALVWTTIGESDGFAWPQRDGLKWPHPALVGVVVDLA